MKVSRETIQTIVNYKHACSDDETRAQLNGVAVRTKNNKLEICVTNGYVLATSSHNIEESAIVDTEWIIIDKTDLRIIDAYLKSRTYQIVFDFKMNERLSVSIDDMTLVPINRDYPNVDRLVDSNKTAKCEEITFNPLLLEQLRKCVAPTMKDARKLKGFTFILNGDIGAMKAKALLNDIEHTLILVPINK